MLIPGKLYKLNCECYFLDNNSWQEIFIEKNSVMMSIYYPSYPEDNYIKFLYGTKIVIISYDFISLFEEVVLW